MVVILLNQFMELLLSDVMELLRRLIAKVCITTLANKGDFGPNDDSLFIHKLVKIIGLVVVGQTNPVSAHFADEFCVLLVMYFVQCIADFRAILVTAHALNLQ